MKRFALIMVASLIISAQVAAPAWAQAQIQRAPTPFGQEIQPNQLEQMGKVDVGDAKLPLFDIQTSGMRWAIAALFFISTPILFIMAIYAGVNMVVRPENEEVVTRARMILLFSLVGLAVMAFAYALVQNVLNLF